jgi:hypothetical protein
MKTLFHSSDFQYLKAILKGNKRFYYSKENYIIFVCGASLTSDNKINARKNFLKYAERHLREYDFFIAEDFLFTEETITDLLSLEDKMTSYSDCIMIFLESFSAGAELGAFSIKDNIAKQLLVINDIEHEGNNSFIEKGPLAKINKISKFAPVIYCKLNMALEAIPRIKGVIEKNHKNRNQGVELFNLDSFNSLSPKRKLLFLLDLITIFSPLTRMELINLLRELFGEGFYKIDDEISMLLIMKYITFVGNYIIKIKNKDKIYFMYGKSQFIRELRSQVINHYHRNRRERWNEYLKYLGESYVS